MNEKTLVEGRFLKKNPFVFVCKILGILLMVVALIMPLVQYDVGFYFEGFLNSLFFSYYAIGGYFLYPALLLFFFAWLFHMMMSRCALTVTDKRVYGKASFGKRVDLPVNQISSVALGMMSAVSIASSSGKIKFWLLENQKEIHDELSKLLIDQQSKEPVFIHKNSSDAEEIKQFKDLLDNGIITQEEFDAKKKQLLGL